MADAVALVRAHLRGDPEPVSGPDGPGAPDPGVLAATVALAGTLVRALALYGDVSADEALALIELDLDQEATPQG